MTPLTVTSFTAAETRMLLASDGSTTLLLQALLGQELRLEVPCQGRTGAEVFPAEVRAAIGAERGGELLVRQSELRTAGGAVVSRNLVVANPERAGTLLGLLGDRRTPLGHGLIAHGLSQSRRLLARGRDDWDRRGGDVPCAFKAYVLAEEGVPSVYVHERFNPVFVPVDGALPAEAASH